MITRYAYPLPREVRLVSSSWELEHYIGQSREMFGGSVDQVQVAPPRIIASLTCSFERKEGGFLDVFLANLAGGRNLAYFGDPFRESDGYSLAEYEDQSAGVLWVDDAGVERYWNDNGTLRPWASYQPRLMEALTVNAQYAPLAGFYANREVFARGSEIAIGDFIYRAAEPARSNARGEVTVKLAPRAQAEHPIHAPVMHSVNALFALQQVNRPERSWSNKGTYQRKMDFVQVREGELLAPVIYEIG